MQEHDRIAREVVLMLAPEELHPDIIRMYERMEETPADQALKSFLWLKQAMAEGTLRKGDFMAGLMTGVTITRAARTELFQQLVANSKKEIELAKGANVVSFIGKKTEQK